MTTTFLFGYGSLINARSRGLTGATGEAIYARVSGLRRGWFAPVAADRITYLGVMRTSGAVCNGVIARIEPASLPSFDAREKSHKRVAVQRSAVDLLDGASLPPGAIWTYECAGLKAPSEANPIVQSYVDVVLDGCLEHGEPFAREFVSLTAGWRGPWIDDRARPRYPRHVPSPDRIARIDALLDQAGVLQFRQT